MKKILIILGIVAAVGVVLVAVVVFKAVGAFREAHGRALYSGVGSWTRIQEFAHAEGKSNYIAHADEMVATLKNDLGTWRQRAEARGMDLSRFEKMRVIAYEITDRSIKNGQNPLAYLDVPEQGKPATSAEPIPSEGNTNAGAPLGQEN